MVRNCMMLLVLLLVLAGNVRAETPPLATLLQNVAQATDWRAQHVRFKQEVQLRALLLTWRFSATVEAKDGSYSVSVGSGAPSFLSPNVLADLVDVHSSIDLFDLELIDVETDHGGRTFYVVEGVRKEPASQGVQSGTLWIDGSEWYIARAHLTYTWGKLEVEQTYRMEQGRLVLDTQKGVTSLLGGRVEVKYLDYWFADP